MPRPTTRGSASSAATATTCTSSLPRHPARRSSTWAAAPAGTPGSSTPAVPGVVGMDADEGMLAAARLAHPDVPFVRADAVSFGLADLGVDRPFDACVSNAALHWMTPQEGGAAQRACGAGRGCEVRGRDGWSGQHRPPGCVLARRTRGPRSRRSTPLSRTTSRRSRSSRSRWSRPGSASSTCGGSVARHRWVPGRQRPTGRVTSARRPGRTCRVSVTPSSPLPSTRRRRNAACTTRTAGPPTTAGLRFVAIAS
jgi:hypothetical protein